MKSNVKLLIASAAVLVVLAAAVIALNMLGGNSDNDPEETEATTVTEPLSRLLYEKDPAQISNIHVKNESSEYDIKKFADDAWFIADFVGFTHNTDTILTALEKAAVMTSQQVASENAEDMAVYGLDAPRAEVTVEFPDETKKFMIGSDAPKSGLTYISYDGEKKVHAVNTSDIEVFLTDRFDFLNKTVYKPKQAENAEDTTNYSKINSITISRKDIDYDIVLEYDVRQDSEDVVSGNSATHIMTSPVRLDLNPDKSYEVLNNVLNLTASKVAAVGPSEDTLEKLGLSDPFAEVNFDIVGGDFTLYIGNEYIDENGTASGYFCAAEGINEVFIFDKATVPWAYIMPLDISMTMITTAYIYDIDSIEVSAGGKNVHFDLNKDSDNFAVSCADAEIDPDKFKNFYQYFLRAPAEELFLEEVTGTPDVTVKIDCGGTVTEVEFIKSEDRMSVIRINGKSSYKCRTAYSSRLAENFERLLNGEDMITTW